MAKKKRVLQEIAPILRVADLADQSSMPGIAYLCRSYALQKANLLDPTSSGPGVVEFKTALSRWLENQRLTMMRRLDESDAAQGLREVYQSCYERVEAVRADEKASRALLTQAYEVAAVLYEVLGALNASDSLPRAPTWKECLLGPRAIGKVADDIDGAIKIILNVLGATNFDAFSDNYQGVVYFDGWNGLGASVVLRAISKLLKCGKCEELHFDKIIHINCSQWKSRRAMQRAIVEELQLDSFVIMLDTEDELDDFRGVDANARNEIVDVRRAIYRSLEKLGFLMIFHNGSDHEIDIQALGIPPTDGFSEKRVLWTYHGRFRDSSVTEEMLKANPYLLTLEFSNQRINWENWKAILYKEAEEIVQYIGVHDVEPGVVVDCYLYRHFIRDDWDAHTSNYWICDGIIKGDKAWEVGNALQVEMRCDDSCEWLGRKYKEWISMRKHYKHWISTEDIDSNYNVPYPRSDHEASSYFLTCKDGSGSKVLPNNLFEGYKKLHVIKLGWCAFNFASPPFICCDSLKLLWLDHCTDNGIDGGGLEHKSWPFFQSLWVLDLHYTDWRWILSPHIIKLMTHLRELNIKGAECWTLSHVWQGLSNVRKLRVMKSTYKEAADGNSFKGMRNLELIDLSSSNTMQILLSQSLVRSIKVLILDGCVELENVISENLPLLESFSFDGYGATSNWKNSMQLPKKDLRPNSRNVIKDAKVKVSNISLKGCARLENLFLRGLPNLEKLDLSGTAIKTVDIETVEFTQQKHFFLLGCEQLRWLNLTKQEEVSYEGVIYVDTRGMGSVDNCRESHSFEAQEGGRFHSVFMDGRLISSLHRTLYQTTGWRCVHLHISCSVHGKVGGVNQMEIDPSKMGFILTSPFPYAHISEKVITHFQLWASPELLPLDVHIEIGEGSSNLDGKRQRETLGDLMDCVESLHVHDNSSITTVIPKERSEQVRPHCASLKWCHVERCPNLHAIVSAWRERSGSAFMVLETFWASHLLTAQYIWCKGISKWYPSESFEELRYIHLDNCPRIMYVLPLAFALPKLETLQIAYCSDLRQVFPLDDSIRPMIQSRASDNTMEFPSLKHILLLELPKLQHICEAKMLAPELKSIKLRGCWNLWRLPDVVRGGDEPIVDYEKEWWDKLEWDYTEANHHPSLFKLHHSPYYKKRLPRVSLLR